MKISTNLTNASVFDVCAALGLLGLDLKSGENGYGNHFVWVMLPSFGPEKPGMKFSYSARRNAWGCDNSGSSMTISAAEKMLESLLLLDRRGPYWQIGRITQVLPADALRSQASYVFQGFDRGGNRLRYRAD